MEPETAAIVNNAVTFSQLYPFQTLAKYTWLHNRESWHGSVKVQSINKKRQELRRKLPAILPSIFFQVFENSFVVRVWDYLTFFVW